MAIEVLIAGDIRLYREGLAQALASDERIRILDTAHSRTDTIAKVEALKPDAVVLDTAMPESMETVAEITAAAPGTKVVALAVPETDAEVIACAEAGVSGYVPRDGSLDDLVNTIQSVRRNESPCSPRMAAALIRRLRSLANGQIDGAPGPLTKRETEVLLLVDDGLSNKEIAARLGVSPATIKNHVHNILEKLRVHRRGEAASHMRRTFSVHSRRVPLD